MKLLHFIGCCLSLFVASQARTEDKYANTLGWEWRVVPNEPMSFSASRGYLTISEAGPDDQFTVTLARPTADDGVRGTQIVAFDKNGKSHRLAPQQGGGQGGVSLQRWSLPVENLRATDVEAFGIEVLTVRSVANATKAASERAQKTGTEVLPFPIVGEPYNFKLTVKPGLQVSSDNTKGKVVLIDCWASWCSPCVDKLPLLNSLHNGDADKGLAVLGVNFDQSPEAMNRVVTRLDIAWPNAFVATDEDTRDIWHAATGIMSLPRVLLVDRKGVLRADFDTLKEDQLQTLVSRLLSEPE